MPTLTESASWLVNAGIDDMQRRLAAMTGTPQDLADLQSAIAHEQSATKLTQRVTRLKPMEAKLRKFQSVGPHKLPLGNLDDKTAAERLQPVEIVTAAQVDTAELAGLAQAITRSREIIHKHEAACHETTLEHYLDAGQMLARAQEIFTLSKPEQLAAARDSKALMSRRDTSEPETSPEILAIRGFSAWLAAELPTLKRPTAIKYATAYRALDLPLTAKPTEIRAALKTLRHQAGKAGAPMPTLAALVKAAPKQSKLQIILPSIDVEQPQQLRIGDAREFVHTWIQTWDKGIKAGRIENLPAAELPDLERFLTEARDHIRTRIKSTKLAIK